MTTYVDLPKTGQKTWRRKMYHQLTITWMDAIKELEYEGSLCDWVMDYLKRMEYAQEFEMCAGLRDMIDEYSERLHC